MNLKKNKNEKETEENNLSINEIANKLIQERNKVLDDFAKAYIAETKIMPSKLELVCREERNGSTIEHVYFFREKKDES